MKKMTIIAVALMFIAAAFSFTLKHPASDTNRKALQNLSGTYKDAKPADWGRGTYGTREFTFDRGKWTLRFVLALDPGMKNPIFEFRTFGTYKVLDKSATVSDAYNALFLEERKFVTLKTADDKLAQAFGLGQCGLIKDQEKDISLSGCSLWKPVAECNEDHDLLSIDKDGKLYFGLRPADNNMCTPDRRPTRLYVPVINH